MNPPSLDEQKLLVARMLPEEITITKDSLLRLDRDGSGKLQPVKGVAFGWLKDANHRRVTDEEWLHVCHLAEQTLSTDDGNDEMAEYCFQLEQLVMDGLCDLEYNKHVQTITANAEHRLQALVRTKHPELYQQ